MAPGAAVVGFGYPQTYHKHPNFSRLADSLSLVDRVSLFIAFKRRSRKLCEVSGCEWGVANNALDSICVLYLRVFLIDDADGPHKRSCVIEGHDLTVFEVQHWLAGCVAEWCVLQSDTWGEIRTTESPGS